MRLLIQLIAVLFCSTAMAMPAGDATAPANLSPRGVAEWAINGGWISSGTGALPSAGQTGAWYIDLSDPASPKTYRSNGSSWVLTGGSGGGVATDSSASLSAHISDYEDPHGATETITVGLTIGSGTPDAIIEHISTGTLKIASYAVLAPETATPGGTIATGTLWWDANYNNIRAYSSATWTSLGPTTFDSRWDDVVVPLLSQKVGASKVPAWTQLKSSGGSVGVYTYGFNAGEEDETFFTVQFPHKVIRNSLWDIHVHWAPTTTGVGTVTWGLEYWIASTTYSFPANTTTVYGSTYISTNSQYKHLITEILETTMPVNDSTILVGRFHRVATDTYAGVAGALSLDAHYQSNRRGSVNEWGD